jgi:hypothetical protein
MPPQNRSILEQTKAYQTEQLRLRTETRLAQLRQEQRQLEISEVLYVRILAMISLGELIDEWNTMDDNNCMSSHEID